jgi:methionyl-tRNA formyltransferase
MRIVFMGTNLTGWLCLNEILTMGEQVVGIFTTPASFEISYSAKRVNVATHRSFDGLARENNIPLLTVTGKLGTYAERLRELQPDLVLVSGWYHLIPQTMLSIPRLGCIGFHPSLLPKYRGGAPLSWAIINGERATGMSMFYFDNGVDSGDVIGQAHVSIDDRDTIATLYEKINRATLVLIRQLVPKLKNGSAPRLKQDESQATYFPQRSPEDGLIDWGRPARAIYDWVRAQTTPYPGAYTYLDNQKVVIWAAELLGRPNNQVPGMNGYVMRTHRGQGVEVLTGDGSLLITEVETADRRARADEILHRPGVRLGLQTPAMAAGLAKCLEVFKHDA